MGADVIFVCSWGGIVWAEMEEGRSCVKGRGLGHAIYMVFYGIIYIIRHLYGII